MKKKFKVKAKGLKSLVIKAKTEDKAVLKYISEQMKNPSIELIRKKDIKVKLKN